MIKSIVRAKNILEYQEHHERYYSTDKGILFIETDDELHILNLDSGADLTNCDYIKIKILKDITTFKYLYKNHMEIEDYNIEMRLSTRINNMFYRTNQKLENKYNHLLEEKYAKFLKEKE